MSVEPPTLSISGAGTLGVLREISNSIPCRGSQPKTPQKEEASV